MKGPRIVLIPLMLLVFTALPRMSAAFEDKEIRLTDVPLTLEQAMEIAKRNNRSIQESVHGFNVAQKQVAETRARFNPTLSLDGNWQRVHDSSSFSMLTYNPLDISGYFAPGTLVTPAGTPLYVASPMPTVQQFPISSKQGRSMDMTFAVPVLTFGTRAKSIKARQFGRDSQELDVERVSLDVAFKTKEAFYNYMLAKSNHEVVKKNLILAEDHLKGATARYDQGTIPYFDVIRSEVSVTEAKEKLATAEKGLELARMVLNNLLGYPVERATDIRYELGNLQPTSLKPVQEYVNFALTNRVELRQIQLGREQASLGAQLSKNRPMVSFAYLRNIISKGSSFSSDNSWRYVVSYSMDLYDSGLARARVQQGREQTRTHEIKEVDAREGIILQTQQAYLNLQEAIKRLETSKAIMREATRAREIAEVGHQQGVVSELDWKDALFGELQAGLNAAKTEFDLQMAKAQLASALGLENIEDF